MRVKYNTHQENHLVKIFISFHIPLQVLAELPLQSHCHQRSSPDSARVVVLTGIPHNIHKKKINPAFPTYAAQPTK